MLTPPGVPATAQYGSGCANNQPNALSVKVGLSRGWGDIYSATTVGQYIDVTGLPDGQYRVRAVADPQNDFTQISRTNDTTWVDIQLQGNQVSVLKYGPSAPKVS